MPPQKLYFLVYEPRTRFLGDFGSVQLLFSRALCHSLLVSILISAMVWVQNVSPAVDAVSQYPTIIAVCVSMTVFMMFIVSLRVYVRAVMIKMMGMDDWIVVLSAVCLSD